MGHGQRRQADEDHPHQHRFRVGLIGKPPQRQPPGTPSLAEPSPNGPPIWMPQPRSRTGNPVHPGKRPESRSEKPAGRGAHHEYDNSGGSQGNERGNACNYPAYRWLQNYPDSAGRTKQEYLKFRIAKSSGKGVYPIDIR